MTTDTVATKNIKVLMVDDHEIMRQAYGMLLNTDPDIEIVGFAGDGQEALVLADTLGPERCDHGRSYATPERCGCCPNYSGKAPRHGDRFTFSFR